MNEYAVFWFRNSSEIFKNKASTLYFIFPQSISMHINTFYCNYAIISIYSYECK